MDFPDCLLLLLSISVFLLFSFFLLFLNFFYYLLVYKSMVRPHLEYANSVWCPHKLGDIKEIEKVQKIATIKHPSGLSNSFQIPFENVQ